MSATGFYLILFILIWLVQLASLKISLSGLLLSLFCGVSIALNHFSGM